VLIPYLASDLSKVLPQAFQRRVRFFKFSQGLAWGFKNLHSSLGCQCCISRFKLPILEVVIPNIDSKFSN